MNEAVSNSVKTAGKIKPHAPKSVNQIAESKLLSKVRRLWHKKPVNQGGDWSEAEVLLCNIVAWVGAIAITVVVLRSLYLMYLKPEGT